MLSIIGDQFDECKAEHGHSRTNSNNGAHDEIEGDSDGGEEHAGDWPEICGATLSVRQSEDILSVWNRVDGDLKLRESIR